MSLLLCHECYHWVDARAGRCSSCDHPIDQNIPDPDPIDIGQQIGTAIGVLGCIHTRRSRLPETGLLYATTRGVLFVPHRVAYISRMVRKSTWPTRIMVGLASMVWLPFMLLTPFVVKKKHVERRVKILEPTVLNPDQRDERTLASLLMKDPGVFFVPLSSIRAISPGWWEWKIERYGLRPIRLRPAAADAFDSAIQSLAEREDWRRLLHES